MDSTKCVFNRFLMSWLLLFIGFFSGTTKAAIHELLCFYRLVPVIYTTNDVYIIELSLDSSKQSPEELRNSIETIKEKTNGYSFVLRPMDGELDRKLQDMQEETPCLSFITTKDLDTLSSFEAACLKLVRRYEVLLPPLLHSVFSGDIDHIEHEQMRAVDALSVQDILGRNAEALLYLLARDEDGERRIKNILAESTENEERDDVCSDSPLPVLRSGNVLQLSGFSKMRLNTKRYLFSFIALQDNEELQFNDKGDIPLSLESMNDIHYRLVVKYEEYSFSGGSTSITPLEHDFLRRTSESGFLSPASFGRGSPGSWGTHSPAFKKFRLGSPLGSNISANANKEPKSIQDMSSQDIKGKKIPIKVVTASASKEYPEGSFFTPLGCSSESKSSRPVKKATCRLKQLSSPDAI
ncbi:hypothetical protein CI610_00185 [invertebrate metagenome]|uniref:Uncharacterized protein n=1 Tax=invertebrate metagenome TaxID=1711999 RepID=A0A2H9TC68_9ZZZZ